MNVDQILLSICIPTFNRGSFIGFTLESIANQSLPGVEVVVMDGASSDNTNEVVSSFSSRIPNLVYHRAVANGGIDADIQKTVGLATGKYCWLMSSDDLLAPGAITDVISELKTGDDIYLWDFTLCDAQVTPISATELLARSRDHDRFDIASREQLLEYFSVALSNNALFCFISNIVFKRQRWVEAPDSSNLYGSCYAHVFKILSFSHRSCLLRYVPRSVVLNRAYNDSFSTEGMKRRLMLDFEGYLMLADRLFPDDNDLREGFLSVMPRQHPWFRIVKLRSEVAQAAEWEQISRLLERFGYSRRLLKACGVIGMLRPLVRAALYVNRTYPRLFFFRWAKDGLFSWK